MAERRPVRAFRVLLVAPLGLSSEPVRRIADGLHDNGIEVQIVLGPTNGQSRETRTTDVQVWSDDQWEGRETTDTPLHIQIRRWADLVLVLPLTPDFLARIASAGTDTLALAVLRLAPPQLQPVILVPSFHPDEWRYPMTRLQLALLQDNLEYLVLGPRGEGRMLDPAEILDTIQTFATTFSPPQPVASSSSSDPEAQPNLPLKLQPSAGTLEPSLTSQQGSSSSSQRTGNPRPPSLFVPAPSLPSLPDQDDYGKRAERRMANSTNPGGAGPVAPLELPEGLGWTRRVEQQTEGGGGGRGGQSGRWGNKWWVGWG